MGHAVRTWSAVCSKALHSQFGEGARPHLYMDERNRPTPVLKRLSLTQAAREKPIPTGLYQPWAQKHGAWKQFHSIRLFICDLSTQKRGCKVRQDSPKASTQLAQMGVWILVSLGEHPRHDTRLVRSTQLLSRPVIRRLCEVFWHYHPIPSLQIASAV